MSFTIALFSTGGIHIHPGVCMCFVLHVLEVCFHVPDVILKEVWHTLELYGRYQQLQCATWSVWFCIQCFSFTQVFSQIFLMEFNVH